MSNAVQQAIREIQASSLSFELKQTAVENLQKGTFSAATNASGFAKGGAITFWINGVAH